MTNQEIKLRLTEAFIAQKTLPSDIPEYADKLLEYINKDNKVDLDIAHNELLEAGRKIQALNSEEEKIRKIYFDFYDKMEEPERSEAKENWDYEYARRWTNNISTNFINFGFEFHETKQGACYWFGVRKKYL